MGGALYWGLTLYKTIPPVTYVSFFVQTMEIRFLTAIGTSSLNHLWGQQSLLFERYPQK